MGQLRFSVRNMQRYKLDSWSTIFNLFSLDSEERKNLNNSIVEKLERDLLFLGFIGIQDKIADRVEGKS